MVGGVAARHHLPGRDLRHGGDVAQLRVADDFGTIRARIEELRRERVRTASADCSDQSTTAQPHWDVDESRLHDLERRRKEKSEGTPPPWVPTIFFRT
jgi:hypothetical protein